MDKRFYIGIYHEGRIIMANKLEPIGKSSLGMDENVAALLSIIVAPITSIIFYMMEKESKFVKFHAMQSLLVYAGIIVLNIVGGILALIPIIGILIGIVLFLANLASAVLWVMLLIKAYQGEWFEIPVIGGIALQQISK